MIGWSLIHDWVMHSCHLLWKMRSANLLDSKDVAQSCQVYSPAVLLAKARLQLLPLLPVSKTWSYETSIFLSINCVVRSFPPWSPYRNTGNTTEAVRTKCQEMAGYVRTLKDKGRPRKLTPQISRTSCRSWSCYCKSTFVPITGHNHKPAYWETVRACRE